MENESVNDKNHQILNFMYHAIKEQRKLLDIISIEFPKALSREEEIFCKLNRWRSMSGCRRSC